MSRHNMSTERPSRRPASDGLRDLRHCKPFTSLARHAREHQQLQDRLCQALPAPLNEQVRLAGVDDARRLVLLAPSPASAARLRMAQTQLLEAARHADMEADNIVVKVVPETAAASAPPPAGAPLSPVVADHLRTAARAQPDHELRDLLLGLASIAESSDSPASTD